MRVQLKRQVNMKWETVPAAELTGRSLADYIADTFEPVVAAIYEDGCEDPCIFIVNLEKMVEPMKKKGIVFMAKQFQEFLGTQIVPKVVVSTFPDGKFIEIGPEKPREE